jgi:DNA repair exonuclease SbcCD ATPase subunit
MDDTKNMLRTIINGQSSLKSELLGEIKKVDKKIDDVDGKIEDLKKETRQGFKEVNKRIDKLGKSLAFLEDDAPTWEDFDRLEGRVKKVEQKVATI